MWAKRTGEVWEGQGVKAIGASALEKLNAPVGTLVLAVAATDRVANPALSAVRSALVKRAGTRMVADHAFLWVVDFPLFEPGEQWRTHLRAPPVHLAAS